RLESGTITEARVALGGVAHKPWRDEERKASLCGREPDDAVFSAFADSVLKHARGQGQNDFKIELARRAIVRTLRQASQGNPQNQSDKRIN
ncbi:MAG TPA: FAD-binding molybdopterin dehydrogenase, partial [Afipia sp.]|nr:FAD-binding molybdopterin dehydrogenase [Afipia sp.]